MGLEEDWLLLLPCTFVHCRMMACSLHPCWIGTGGGVEADPPDTNFQSPVWGSSSTSGGLNPPPTPPTNRTLISYRNSVRPFACLTHACFVTKPNNALRILWYHTKRESLYFSDTNNGWWATFPSVWNLRSNWPTPFDKRRLRHIFANVSTVRDSEKVKFWRIESRSRAFQGAKVTHSLKSPSSRGLSATAELLVLDDLPAATGIAYLNIAFGHTAGVHNISQRGSTENARHETTAQ